MFERIYQLVDENPQLSISVKEEILKEINKCKKEVQRKDFKSKRLKLEYEVNKRFLNTSVQELEEKNILLKKYVESNLQLENFAHIASHDLKAPLNNILSFSGLLQKTSIEKLNPSEEKFIQFIVASAQNMRQTIQALLQFSVVTNTKLKVDNFSLKELLVHLERDLKSTLSQKRVQLHIHDLPDYIVGDAILLREVFQNLILNGIKFTLNKTPRIDISANESATHWVFSIQDNGIGIATEYQEKIFIMLQRLNTKSDFEGTGMGLSICKKIVEQHNGKIWVESKIGEGSTFYFSIEKPKTMQHSNSEKIAVST